MTPSRSVEGSAEGRRAESRRRVAYGVRLAITVFVVVILAIVGLGWRWTARHQAPPLSTASHVVLAVAAFAAIFAVARIWRADGPRSHSGES